MFFPHSFIPLVIVGSGFVMYSVKVIVRHRLVDDDGEGHRTEYTGREAVRRGIALAVIGVVVIILAIASFYVDFLRALR